MSTQEKTKVVFRKWRKGGDIIALFPDFEVLPGNKSYCMSYEHAGQHGPADYGIVTRDTEPATPGEYADLKAELEQLGYNLEIVSRRPSKRAR